MISAGVRAQPRAPHKAAASAAEAAKAAKAVLRCGQQQPATLPAPPEITRGQPAEGEGGGGLLYQRRDPLALAVGVRVRVLVVAPVALRLVSSEASAKVKLKR